VPNTDALDIVLALSEACANAVEHPTAASRPIFEVNAERRGREIHITVRDFGRWSADEHGRDEHDPGDLSGRGLMMMRALMDHVDVVEDETGTTILMRRKIRAAPRTATAASAPRGR
jgi:anti-sigma regulatory factor (Ser/Thr protein kinase)